MLRETRENRQALARDKAGKTKKLVAPVAPPAKAGKKGAPLAKPSKGAALPPAKGVALPPGKKGSAPPARAAKESAPPPSAKAGKKGVVLPPLAAKAGKKGAVLPPPSAKESAPAPSAKAGKKGVVPPAPPSKKGKVAAPEPVGLKAGKGAKLTGKAGLKPVVGEHAPAPSGKGATKGVPSGKGAPSAPGRDGRRPSSPPRRAEPRQALREPPRVAAIPLPTIAPPKRLSMEERAVIIERRLAEQTDDFRKRYGDSFLMSWIYHDAALEGVVYTFEELRGGLSGQAAPGADSGLQPTYDDIRRTKEAVEYVRDMAEKKRLPITVDVIKKIYLILHPEEGDIKTVKYRKDVPQHRLYFHEYAPPDKVAYKIRQIVDWLNDPETRKTRNLVRIAARVHYDLLRVYPFPTDSGKVARLFMNLMLVRGGMPPAIIHSTERQRYYEALKGSANTVLQMVQEAVENSLASVEKLLDEHESKKRAFVS